jgi:hypothetical protein
MLSIVKLFHDRLAPAAEGQGIKIIERLLVVIVSVPEGYSGELLASGG